VASHIASSQISRNRVRIAQAAARLIAEHGLSDWAAAKRKACRELGLSDREALPANEEIEQALRDYNSLFQPQAQAASLRTQRMIALEWMERLLPWRPLLVGGVAAGWATAHSDVRLELEAEDPKAVELGLINAGIEYTAVPPPGGTTSGARLNVGRGAAAVRLDIVSSQQRRDRPRRNDEERLSLSDLKALLANAASAADPAS
jgi:hypothetical protein